MGQIPQCEREIEECVSCERVGGIAIFDLSGEELSRDLEDAVRKPPAHFRWELAASPSYIPPLYPPDSRHAPVGSPLSFCEQSFSDKTIYLGPAPAPGSNALGGNVQPANRKADQWDSLPVERMDDESREKQRSFATEPPSDYGSIYRHPARPQSVPRMGFEIASIDSRPLPPPPPRIVTPPKPPPSAPPPYPAEEERARPTVPSFQAKFDDLVSSAVWDSNLAVEGASFLFGHHELRQPSWSREQHGCCPHCKRCPVCGQAHVSSGRAAALLDSECGHASHRASPRAAGNSHNACQDHWFQRSEPPADFRHEHRKEEDLDLGCQTNNTPAPMPALEPGAPLYQDPGRPLFGPWPPKLMQTPECGSTSQFAPVGAAVAALQPSTSTPWPADVQLRSASPSGFELHLGQQGQRLLTGPARAAPAVAAVTPRTLTASPAPLMASGTLTQTALLPAATLPGDTASVAKVSTAIVSATMSSATVTAAAAPVPLSIQ